jgi:WbqC-like protein family
MSKRVAILQSNYIPWKGYFDIIHDVDELVFLDHVQYTKLDWRNRNRIKTAAGVRWLTIPVGSDEHRRICDVELPREWGAKHWRHIAEAYRRAPYFATYRPLFEDIYRRSWQTLSEINQHIIRIVAAQLGVTTRFRDSRELDVCSHRQQMVLDILDRVGADVYVSGPAAKTYIEPERFAERGIELVWKSYHGYPEYAQLHPPFVHEVTILDLLFHTGPDAPHYIWGWRKA